VTPRPVRRSGAKSDEKKNTLRVEKEKHHMTSYLKGFIGFIWFYGRKLSTGLNFSI
jgi:hypothetical protein